jgi:hypothetical protein
MQKSGDKLTLVVRVAIPSLSLDFTEGGALGTVRQAVLRGSFKTGCLLHRYEALRPLDRN